MMYLFLLGRIILGGYFIKSGFHHFKNHEGLAGYAKMKGVPMPKESVYLTGLMMFLGGLGILLGVYIGPSVTLLVLFLFGAMIKMHAYWKETEPMARMSDHINFFKNLALIGALLMLLAIPMSEWAYPLAIH